MEWECLGLLESFRRACEDKVREEESVREQFVLNIDQLNEERKDLMAKFGPTCDNGNSSTHASRESSSNLTDRLAELELRVEELRQKREAQVGAMRSLQERMEMIARRMGGELEDRFVDLEEDLTDARRAAFSEKLKEMEGEESQRKKMVAQLVADCQGLMRELRVEPRAPFELQVRSSRSRSSTMHGHLLGPTTIIA